MNREQVLQWAREAGAEPMRGALEHCEFWCEYRVLEHFARLVRAAALEEAKEAYWSVIKPLRFERAHHLGLGDIRLTIGQQEEIADVIEALKVKP